MFALWQVVALAFEICHGRCVMSKVGLYKKESIPKRHTLA